MHLQTAENTKQADTLRRTLDNMPDGLLLFCKEGRLREANTAALNILKEHLDEMPQAITLGFFIEKFMGKPRRSEGISYQSFREAIQTDNGKTFLISIFQLDEGESAVTLTEISAFLNQEIYKKDALFQSQKLEALGQFAGGIAHDFNNILSIVEGYARVLQKRLSEGHETGDALDKILTAAERGAGLTRQLLAFGRHKIVIEEECDLRDLVEEQVKMLKPLLAETIQMRIDRAASPAMVRCSHDAIAQILMNLVLNACDAMPEEGGTISFSTFFCRRDMLPESLRAHGESFICLLVNDTGLGMDKETLRRAAEPFFTTKDTGKGTGLGLSVVAGLVEQMKGAIAIESQPGLGASISIYLPAAENQVVKATQPVREDTPDVKGRTVLLVEDENDLRSVLAELLQDMGLKVLSAANGSEALLVQDGFEGKIDFLLTDVVMPEMNGVKLATLIKSLRPDMRVIYISGYPAGSKIANITFPGSACLLAKPVGAKDICRAFSEKLKNPDWRPQGQILHWEGNALAAGEERS